MDALTDIELVNLTIDEVVTNFIYQCGENSILQVGRVIEGISMQISEKHETSLRKVLGLQAQNIIQGGL